MRTAGIFVVCAFPVFIIWINYINKYHLVKYVHTEIVALLLSPVIIKSELTLFSVCWEGLHSYRVFSKELTLLFSFYRGRVCRDGCQPAAASHYEE